MGNTKKSTYKGNTDAHRRGNAKYLSETVESFVVRVPKGKKEYYKNAADSFGLSLNSFVVSSMDEKIAASRDSEND